MNNDQIRLYAMACKKLGGEVKLIFINPSENEKKINELSNLESQLDEIDKQKEEL